MPGEVRFSSHLAEKISCTRHNGGIRIAFLRIDGMNMSAICTLVIDRNTGLSHWRISIENHTMFAIKLVEYPVIEAVSRLGDSEEDDRILLPKQDGYLLPNPHVMRWEGERPERAYNQRFSYPGEGREIQDGLSAQLLSYYDSGGGMYLGVHDALGCPKYLGPILLRRDECNDVLDFTPCHRIPEAPGNAFDPEYDTVLGCFQGDWQTAAAIYKAWAVGQQWCERKLSQRKDIPEWLKQGAFFLCMRLRYQAGGEAFLGRVQGYVKSWGDALGIPTVAMMCGWEKWGEWTGPDYFPPYGDERFRVMCDTMKRAGIRPFPFGLSGFKLPIRKKIGKDWPQPELAIDYDNRQVYASTYAEHAAIGPDGKALTDSEVESWDGLHAYACIGTKQAYAQIHDASVTLVRDYGVQMCQADQVLDGGTPECYSARHGHPLGKGRWQSERLKEIYRATREDCKKLDPDFVLSQEWPGELFLQCLDAYHSRNYDQPRGVLGVPLFSFLYHEYIPSFGGDWVSFLGDNTSGVFTHASNFVYGNLPAGCPQTMRIMTRNIEIGEADERILTMAKNACAVFGRVQKYLVFGEMLASPAIGVPDIPIRSCGMEFSEWRKRTLLMPAVLHCLWKSSDGSVAWALANISSEPQTFTLPALGGNPPQTYQYILHRNNELPIVMQLENSPGSLVRLHLEALDAAIVEIVGNEKRVRTL